MSDPVTLGIGAAVGKAVFKSWLKDNEFASTLSENIVDVFKGVFADRRSQTAATRQLERISERTADLLSPIISHEWRDLDTSQLSATTLALSDAINSINPTYSYLASIDFDPVKLHREIINKTNFSGLGSSEISLISRLSNECSQLIIDLSGTFSNNGVEAFAEILRRESQMIDSLEKIFQEFEDIRAVVSISSIEASDAYFEETYRKAVGRELDGIELFGIDSQARSSSRHHDLTTAYISLSVSPFYQNSENVDADLETSRPARSLKNVVPIKVEQIAAKIPRIVLRGEAGSGKTTLLQSIAVRCATSSFSSDMEDWNKLIPFFIRLRAVGEIFPSPEQFPFLVAQSISGMMPSGWVHRQLNSGRAILLVDGVDEVSSDKRETARKWLRELVGSYPHCRYVVTSRPAAIADNWLKTTEFEHIDLLPMSPEDVEQLVDQWHLAVSKNEIDTSKKEATLSLPPRLKERIKGDPALRELAATPLLCAMLCAMNRDRKEVLPATRISLYEAAVSMIVHGRDEQRKIRVNDLPEIDYDTKLAILQEVAFWMMQNGWSMAEKWRLQEFVDSIIANYPRISAVGSDSVVDLLLQRSGILRSPFEGRVDFIHNAFKEYLCARAISASDRFGYLENALKYEAWREVATLAPALTENRRRSEFLQKLVRLGDANVRNSSMYYLLAVRCLETCTTLDSDTQDLIRERISRLHPPKNFGEAKALAGAGELALPLIGMNKAKSARAAAACIRTLRYIGTASALEKLEEFAADTRRTVLPEIFSAWPFFDRSEYAKLILSKSPVFSKSLSISSLSMLDGIRELPNLEYLSIYGSTATIGDSHYYELQGMKNLKELEFFRCEAIDLKRLPSIGTLENLSVSADRIYNSDQVKRYPALRNLSIGVVEPFDFPDFSNLPDLKSLFIRAFKFAKFSVSNFPAGLERIIINGEVDPCIVDMLSSLKQPLDFSFTSKIPTESMSKIYKFDSLLQLAIINNSELKNLDGIRGLGALRSLYIQNSENLIAIDGLSDNISIRRLHLNHIPKLKDLSVLSRLKALTHLSLFVNEEANLEPIASLENLQLVYAPVKVQERLLELGLRVAFRPHPPNRVSMSSRRQYVTY